jgi:hypothetical protein
MHPRRSRLQCGAAFAVIALSIGGFVATGRSGGARSASSTTPSPDVLPDLDQELPSELDVRRAVVDGRSVYVLGFRSAVRNIGAGPLIVHGARPDAGTRTMTVDQLVNRSGAPPRTVSGVGTMSYVTSPDHNHWHYLGFDRYELRRAETGERVVADRKSGFCLGDRYDVRPAVPAAPPQPVYTGRCGLDDPGRHHMPEGISAGYGDDYAAFLEGQDLQLSGLPDGRYVLVHRVNADGRLQEFSTANNAASVLLDLRWHGGVPQVQVLDTCPDNDRCGTVGSRV